MYRSVDELKQTNMDLGHLQICKLCSILRFTCVVNHCKLSLLELCRRALSCQRNNAWVEIESEDIRVVTAANGSFIEQLCLASQWQLRSAKPHKWLLPSPYQFD